MFKPNFENIETQESELLKLTEQQKIEVLKLAYRKGIDVWFETSRIFLNHSPRNGGLTTEAIEKLFQTLVLKSHDIFGDEIK